MEAPTIPSRQHASLLLVGPYVLLMLSILVTYSNVYHNEFIYDDQYVITGNQFLKSWHSIGSLFVTHGTSEEYAGWHTPYYRPLMLLLYLFVYQAAGPSTIAFHFVNVFLHLVNSCLVYALGVRLGFHRVATFLAALIWAVHPVHTEAVTYVSATAELLCSMFLLSGILVLALAISRRRMSIACLLFAFALLSKETAVVFPVLVMGLMFYRSEARWALKTYFKTWPLWMMTLIYLLVRRILQNGLFESFSSAAAANITIVDRFYTCLATLPTYLRLLLWPTDLHFERDFPTYETFWAMPVMAGFVIAIVALAAIAWKPTRPSTPIAWGMLWAIATFLPVSGIIVRVDAIIFEHWLYLPTIGVVLGIVESLVRLSRRLPSLNPLLAGVAILIACSMGRMTFSQNRVWRDPVSFYSHILNSGEESAYLHYDLGIAYAQRADYEPAIRQFQLALAFPNEFANIHYHLASCIMTLYVDPASLRYQDQASLAEVIQHLQRAIQLDPDHYLATEALADVYARLGDHDKESEYRTRAAATRRVTESRTH